MPVVFCDDRHFLLYMRHASVEKRNFRCSHGRDRSHFAFLRHILSMRGISAISIKEGI